MGTRLVSRLIASGFSACQNIDFSARAHSDCRIGMGKLTKEGPSQSTPETFRPGARAPTLTSPATVSSRTIQSQAHKHTMSSWENYSDKY